MTSSHASRWHRILLFLCVYSLIVRDNHSPRLPMQTDFDALPARCKPHGFRCRGARPGTFTRSVAIGDRCREPILSDDAVRATPTLGPGRGVRRKRLCAVVGGRCRHLGLFDALLGISEWPSSLRFARTRRSGERLGSTTSQALGYQLHVRVIRRVKRLFAQRADRPARRRSPPSARSRRPRHSRRWWSVGPHEARSIRSTCHDIWAACSMTWLSSRLFGLRLSVQASIRRCRASPSSPRMTGRAAVIPCFNALRRDRILPSSVVGSMLFWPFRRLVSARSGVDMAGSISLWVRNRKRLECRTADEAISGRFSQTVVSVFSGLVYRL